MSAPSTTRAAIYLRVSLDATGERLAVTRQRQDCLRIAEQRGWVVVAEYVDNSISASDASKVRPAYAQMESAYREGAFDALICWDLDRLTRQPRQLEDWIDAATDRGLMLVTANGEADLSTDGGRMFARIKASVARGEVERKSARQRRAALQRAEMGRPPKGVRLTGYATDGALVEDEAAIIRDVFKRFDTGDSLRAIASWLAESGVPTRSGRPWNPSSVRTILTNPRYAGRAVYRGKPTGKRGAWEPLVDETTFDLIQARLADPRRRTQVGTDRKHLGAGLFVCGECDTRVISWSGNRYRCPNGCLTRSQTDIDAWVLDIVCERLSRPDLADLLPPQENEEVKRLTAEMTRLRERLDTIAEDYDSGRIDGRRYAVATEKVEAQLRQAESALSRTASNRSLAIIAETDPVAAFERAPLMQRRAIIDALVSVRLHRAPRGRKTFDPDTVKIEGKTYAA